MKAKVIIWIYLDGTDFGVVRVYTDNTGQAEKDFKMLEEHGDKNKKFQLKDSEVHGKAY